MSAYLDSFSERMQARMASVVAVVQGNIYVQAISQGMIGAMGVLVAGSVINLLVNLPIPDWTTILTNIGLYDLLSQSVKIFQLTAAIMCFIIAHSLAKFKGVDSIQAGVLALMCFYLTIPIETTEAGVDMFALSYLNAGAIFTAMVTALLSCTIFAWTVKRGIVFRLPENIPDFVRDSLNVIPSSLLSVLPFIALRGILAATPFGSFPDFMNAIITMPLSAFGNSFVGSAVFLFFSSLLWWFGIHNAPVSTVAMATMLPALTENIMAAMSGQPAPSLLSFGTYLIPSMLLGGPGCLIGLLLSMLTCKSERYKAQARIQLIPGLFNIIEPAMFGTPIVLNLLLFIPFVFVPQVINVLMYAALQMGLIGTPVVNMNPYLPCFFNGFLIGGGIGMGIFFLFAIVVCTVLWFPFVKIMDNMELKNEQELLAAKGEQGK